MLEFLVQQYLPLSLVELLGEGYYVAYALGVTGIQEGGLSSSTGQQEEDSYQWYETLLCAAA